MIPSDLRIIGDRLEGIGLEGMIVEIEGKKYRITQQENFDHQVTRSWLSLYDNFEILVGEGQV